MCQAVKTVILFLLIVLFLSLVPRFMACIEKSLKACFSISQDVANIYLYLNLCKSECENI